MYQTVIFDLDGTLLDTLDDLSAAVNHALSAHGYPQRERAEVLVENVRLFDTYEGAGIPAGKKSLAYSFTLRSEDHTLNDEEIRHAMDAIIAALDAVGAPLRT